MTQENDTASHEHKRFQWGRPATDEDAMSDTFILSQTPTTSTITVNGKEVPWDFADIPVWPANRIIRYIHRRILKRPPLRYEKNRSVVALKSAPPAGSVVITAYTVESVSR